MACVVGKHFHLARHIEVFRHQCLIGLLVVVHRVANGVVELRLGEIGGTIFRLVLLCLVVIGERTVAFAKHQHHIAHSQIIVHIAWRGSQERTHFADSPHSIVECLVGTHFPCRELHRLPLPLLHAVVGGNGVAVVLQSGVGIGNAQLHLHVVWIALGLNFQHTKPLLHLIGNHIAVGVEHRLVFVFGVRVHMLAHHAQR